MMIVDMLRHGALEGGVKYRGQVDDPLTDAGRQSMNRVWRQLDQDVDVIAASPLSRCALPARDWANGAGIPLLIDERLAELHYGAWEGLSSDEIEQEYPGMLGLWRNDPTGMRPPGGESPEELRARLGAWWREVVGGGEHRHMLIVSHSGVLRMLLTMALGASISATRKFSMPYACWSRLIVKGNSALLAFHQQP